VVHNHQHQSAHLAGRAAARGSGRAHG